MDQNSDLKLILLPAPLHTYLIHVFRRVTANGLVPPEELVAAGELWKRLNEAKTVDFSNLGEVGISKIDPQGMEISLNQAVDENQTAGHEPNPHEQQ